ncbi:hypothetical protein EYZ11_006402 [Aspergillus tanneri]|uniref:Transcription factor domain-containing protein n=1 Tax=Aspergillus tanneri TaxID=1220188 RepID=A0A4S3JFK6_9EURO|nr:hypothetical protein EYZ11_006402 [Aspergillus tanneri]
MLRYVKLLLDKIRSFEGRYGSESVGPNRSAQQSEPVTPAWNVTSNQPQPQENLSCEDGIAGISPATDLTSGPAFESQVKYLLDRSKPCVSPASGMHPSHRGPRESGPRWTSARTLVNDADEPTIPSLEESHHLLDKFLFYLGVNQHFFDPRSFCDSMVLLFQTPETWEQQKRTTWYTEYLLVMAMAKLMDVEQSTCQPPGSDLFAEALRRLPPLHLLGGEGVITVEILTLIATYLQWCDRKHDAYLHVFHPFPE